MVAIPYVVKNRTLMKEGEANGIFYPGKVLENGVAWLKEEIAEDDLEFKNRDSLFYDHDDSCANWLGEVRKIRYDTKEKQIIGDLWIVDRDAADKLDYMIQNDDSKWGISPRLKVLENEKGEVIAFKPKSWAFVLRPAGGKELMLAEEDDFEEDEDEIIFSDLEEDGEGEPVTLLKMEDEEQYALGIVLKPDEPDAHDHSYSGKAIREGARKFWTDYNVMLVEHRDRRGKMPNLFDEKTIEGYSDIQVVDSLVLPHDTVICGRLLPADTWIAGVKVYNSEAWEKIKNGELNGFSIGALGIEE